MMQVVVTKNGHVLGAHSWVDGFRPIKTPCPAVCVRVTDVLARACWLARHVSEEAADEFLDRWTG